MRDTTLENRPKIGVIVAVTKDKNAIGRRTGELLFRISDDLKRFRTLTLGHPIIMGRRTYESIGKPLPERTNIVITRNPDFRAEGCIVVNSLDDAIRKASEIDDKIFVIGGGEIYKEALPYTDKLYITIVDSAVEGEVFFPEWREKFTKEVYREERFDEKTGLHYTWLDLERE